MSKIGLKAETMQQFCNFVSNSAIIRWIRNPSEIKQILLFSVLNETIDTSGNVDKCYGN